MVSIALRAYNNDIGDLIDHQQIEESISHCRHILETYPKHVDTYRLLGKAYLEEKRYGDASDILQRVLSSIPEDFIAHVGMSIIREDEGNFDAAIYHMERAFETQPSNHAIQDELRRLHANRDGIEPPRIRLTRGALARMYAHGHLYDQAIAELLAAISEDAQRFDLQTLLAEMYYQNGKKVDSAETCTKILEKLPYCLKANQLLTIILEENDRADDAQRYRKRWEALDPYAGFTNPDTPNPHKIPDTQIKIERIDWEPESFLEGQADQPAWASSLGVSLDRDEDSDEDIPVWLDEDISSEEGDLPDFELQEDEMVDDFFSAEEPSDSPLFDEESAEPAPEDWMRDTDERDDLGLFGDETLETEPELKEDEGIDFLAEERAESDDDDWMSEFAIQDEPGTGTREDDTLDIKEDWLGSLDTEDADAPSTPKAEDEAEDDDWLSTLGVSDEAEPSAPGTDDDTEEKDWIASLGAGQETAEEDETEDDDWLSTLEVSDETEPSSVEADDDKEEEDWIASLGAGQETADEEETEDDDWLSTLGVSDEAEPALPEPDDDTEEDDWIASLGAGQETVEEDETEDDDWLSTLGVSDETEPSAPEADQEELELPGFLMEAGWEKSSGSAEETGELGFSSEAEQPEELEQAEIPDWIRDMAPAEDDQPAEPSGEISAEADPDWLEELDQQPASPAPDWLSELGDSDTPVSEAAETEEPEISKEIQADDLDMAWLESLAAKQGIPDEELVTSPEQRADVSAHHTPEGTTPEQEGSPPDEEEADADWLASLADDETAADEDWLSELEAPPETASPLPDEEAQPVLEDEDDFDMDWLDQIGLEAAEEAAATSIEPESSEEPVDVETEEGLPGGIIEEIAAAEDDWLSELESQPETVSPAPADEVQPVLEEEDDFDMDWLDQIGIEAAEEAAATSLEPESGEETTELDAEDILSGVLAQEDVETEDDWLSELETQPDTGVSPTDEAQPVLEDDDDFDMDWLDQIGQQAAEEAAATSIEPESTEESDDVGAAEGLPDGKPEENAEAEDDWLSEPKAQPETGSPPPADETQPILEDEDDFDTGWLDAIGQQAAEEAAATSLETPGQEPEDPPGEATEAWLAAVGAEQDTEPEPDTDTTGQFLSGLSDLESDEASSGVTEFLSGLGRAKPEADDEALPDEPELDFSAEDEEASMMGWPDEADQQPEEQLPTVFEEQKEPEEDSGLAIEDIEADGVQEIQESFAPREEPPIEEALEEEILPTQSAEWQTESQVNIQAQETPGPETSEALAAPGPDTPEGILETAKAAASQGRLDEAVKGFSALVGKGKLVDAVIDEVTEALHRHPVNVELWQVLGDAYMRIDNLQEALDAYTKAEELLR